ncbi:hypothetical protein GQ607_011552 [Colletotrichum asianum]|uniref:Uncharacterized protein n=1 Tax=Colletotrichum asianum TaxID=702518 RepID=A0A8H3W8D4_9PEZI|nr:hypothetical protein GQ607_011552 [Colletotrichum asianum]
MDPCVRCVDVHSRKKCGKNFREDFDKETSESGEGSTTHGHSTAHGSEWDGMGWDGMGWDGMGSW